MSYSKLLAVANKHGKVTKELIVNELKIKRSQIPYLLHEFIKTTETLNITLLLQVFDKDIIDPYLINDEGLTPLQVAVQLKRWEYVCAIVLAPGLDHARARTGYALFEAVKCGETLTANIVAAQNCDLNYRAFDTAYTAMDMAMIMGNVVLLELFLAKKINVNERVQNYPLLVETFVRQPTLNIEILKLLLHYQVDFSNVLVELIRLGRWQKVDLILQHLPNANDKLLSAMIYECVEQNEVEPVLIYAEQGGDFRTFIKDKTALQLAAQLGHFQLIAQVVTQIKNPGRLGLELILVLLAQAEQWELLNQILALKPNLDAIVQNTALMMVLIEKDRVDAIQKIIALGASVNLKVGDQKPIDLAISLKRTSVITLLCQHKADIDENVLKKAVKDQRWKALELIMTECTYVNKTLLVQHVLVPAVKADQTQIVALILSLNVDVESILLQLISNKDWSTFKSILSSLKIKPAHLLSALLQQVVMEDDPTLIPFLCELGANPDLKHNGKALITLATDNQKYKVIVPLVSLSKRDPKDDALSFAMVVLADNRQWVIVEAMIDLQVDTSNSYSSHPHKTPAFYAIRDGKLQVLEKILGQGYDVNRSSMDCETLLEYAEEQGDKSQAVDILVRAGADHQAKIIRSAKSKRWTDVDKLIEYHYVTHPNVNETEANKEILINKLRHIAVQHNNHAMFKCYYSKDADITVKVINTNLLQRISDARAWDCLKILLDDNKVQDFPEHDIRYTLTRVIQDGQTPLELIKKLLPLVNKNYQEAKTKNSWIHLAILANRADVVKLLVSMGVRHDLKNAANQLPITLVYLQTDKMEKTIRADLEQLLAPTNRWVSIQDFESGFESGKENISKEGAVKSREISIARLKKRYPDVVARICIEQYKDFVQRLPDQYAHYKQSFDYRLGEEATVENLALVWTAACDTNALTPEDFHSHGHSEASLNKFVYCRKLAIVEKIFQAQKKTQDDSSSGSCSQGTLVKIVEALHSAHPDVTICYSKKLTTEYACEDAVRCMIGLAESKFKAMPANAQRELAKQLNNESDDEIPDFLLPISKEVIQLIRPQYGDLLTDEKLNTFFGPAALKELEFAPLKGLNALILKIGFLKSSSPSLDEQLSQLQKVAQSVYDPQKSNDLFSELMALRKQYDDYCDKVSAMALRTQSITASSSATTEQPDIIEQQNKL